ncbi:spermatogenesis-associated protein 33 isoform X3 [Monodelphis domestica]|uniref:spermatogenesis-associated protein 33 isoform X3 n=1 Tax=Monodelphis domestica TaxID=13616 RepID=UPI0004432163|nr:spermatogenesis-associated protein 33 isoform X3 [Monodelphis domestica]
MNPLMGLNKSKTKSDISKTNTGRGTSNPNGSDAGTMKKGTRTEMAPESKKTEEDEQRFSVPHIVVTRASNETIQGVPLGQDIQRTIRDEIDYGPYYRHRNPSTIDAYLRKEPPKPKQVP